MLIADTCLCEYTDHGHCGPLRADGSVDNDAAIERLAATAVVAGTRRRRHRGALGDDGRPGRGDPPGARCDRARETAILAYAAKTASAFYGPFRDAADSAPAFGDRRGYQMDPANGREALHEMDVDVAEGADMLLVKPALPSLDILAAARARFDVADRRLPGERRVLDDRGRRRERLDRSATRAPRVDDLDPPRRGGFVITYAATDIATWTVESTR